MDAPLSERELAFAKENAKVSGDTQDFQLTWEPGESTMLLDTRKKIMRQYAAKGFITACGVSGTTIRMLKAFDILNVPADILDFRLGVMTCMLTCADHTLYEMLRGSHLVVRPPNENLSDAVNMYQNIEPLTVADE